MIIAFESVILRPKKEDIRSDSFPGSSTSSHKSRSSGAKTFYEKNLENKSANVSKEKNSELAKEIFSTFSDAKLIDVQEDKDE